jgi:uncharacterized protein
MRICFTSDFHGSPDLYAQLDQLLAGDPPDLLILGGDMFADGDAADPVASQRAYVEGEFLKTLRRWKSRQPGLAIAAILGNHDWGLMQDVLRVAGRGDVSVLELGRPLSLGGINLVGYSITPPTPHFVKDLERLDRAEDEPPADGGMVWDATAGRPVAVTAAEHFAGRPSMQDELSRAAAATQPWILVAHAPPVGGKLDRLPTVPYPVGSHAVRAFILARQPLVSLHGHIHESPDVTGAYFEMLGATLCVNPGQSPTRLHAVLFDSVRPRETLRHTVYP